MLGRKVKDKITGFSGIVTGVCSYITGCDQYLVAPKVNKDGTYVKSQWFDENRVMVVGKSLITIEDERVSGPDKPAPRK